eukprot:gnl/MRDRNA2_/MRDRNA2_134594_c0_seq1.p1 gnl/MRDRNA2_/MRDRNA2_134594_c0~~gnl/MRDRNA2_/MRDRNA2_134594_c0_seq1.p1  ORF type:complete len:632 (-),score=111.19 gnl/MRDRNA2_/MRDRNA2_134594_c0_seq1:26-1921(-)
MHRPGLSQDFAAAMRGQRECLVDPNMVRPQATRARSLSPFRNLSPTGLVQTSHWQPQEPRPPLQNMLAPERSASKDVHSVETMHSAESPPSAGPFAQQVRANSKRLQSQTDRARSHSPFRTLSSTGSVQGPQWVPQDSRYAKDKDGTQVLDCAAPKDVHSVETIHSIETLPPKGVFPAAFKPGTQVLHQLPRHKDLPTRGRNVEVSDSHWPGFWTVDAEQLKKRPKHEEWDEISTKTGSSTWDRKTVTTHTIQAQAATPKMAPVRAHAAMPKVVPQSAIPVPSPIQFGPFPNLLQTGQPVVGGAPSKAQSNDDFLKWIFDQADVNKNGSLDFEEFKSFFNGQKGATPVQAPKLPLPVPLQRQQVWSRGPSGQPSIAPTPVAQVSRAPSPAPLSRAPSPAPDSRAPSPAPVSRAPSPALNPSPLGKMMATPHAPLPPPQHNWQPPAQQLTPVCSVPPAPVPKPPPVQPPMAQPPPPTINNNYNTFNFMIAPVPAATGTGENAERQRHAMKQDIDLPPSTSSVRVLSADDWRQRYGASGRPDEAARDGLYAFQERQHSHPPWTPPNGWNAPGTGEYVYQLGARQRIHREGDQKSGSLPQPIPLSDIRRQKADAERNPRATGVPMKYNPQRRHR